MIKKNILLLLLFSLFSYFSFGQFPFSPYDRNPNPKPIITYHPYHNHVQVIEIDYREYGWSAPPASIDHIYLAPQGDILVRDEKGTILKQYKIKTFQPLTGGVYYHSAAEVPEIPALLSPEESVKETQPGSTFYFRINGPFINSMATFVVQDKNTSKAILIDSIGNEILEAKYDNIIPSYDCYLIELEGMWGILSPELKELIHTKYPFLWPSHEHSFIFEAQSKNGKYGLIDPSGKIILPCQYDDRVGIFYNGFAEVKIDGKIGFINQQYKEVVKPIYDDAWTFEKNGYTKVCLKGKWGIIDTTGKVIIPRKYDNIGKFREGMLCIEQNGKWGFINQKEKLVIECIYEEQPADFYDGLAKIVESTNFDYYIFHFIDKMGKEIFRCQYRLAFEFSEGLLRVENEQHQYGFVDKKGKEVIACTYYFAEDFQNGIAKVLFKEGGKEFFINKEGKVMKE
jgi:hypothetical protein